MLHQVAAMTAGVLVLAATCAAQTSSSAPAPATAPASQPAPNDFRALAVKLSAEITQLPPIAQNPARVVIALQALDNKTENMPGRDLALYTAKLTSLLNTGAASDRLTFVEPRAAVAATAPAPNPRAIPIFTLKGELHSVTLGDKTYYLLTLHLTDLSTGKMVWENSYELQNLN